MPDLVIVGAGLAGMFAGALAARRGLDTLVIARGVGGLYESAGTIDLHGYTGRRALPEPQLDAFADAHPYACLRARVPDALDVFKNICADHGLAMVGSPEQNQLLPTALGAPRAACLAPQSFVAGDLTRDDPIVIGRLPGFRDFYPQMLAANLRQQTHILDLPFPNWPRNREAYATDIARRLDDPDIRARVIESWQAAWETLPPEVRAGPARLGVPAVLGLNQAARVHAEVQQLLSCEVFEIPVLPPSVPGMRIFDALRDELRSHGGELMLGPTVHGEITRHGSARIVAAAHGSERSERSYPARAVLLATGGFGHGGLEADMDAHVRETVFDLPVAHVPTRRRWSSTRYLNPHRFARCGVQTDAAGRALRNLGAPAADNLWACGSILAGADRLSEGSREGIALASAFAAVSDIIAAQ